MKAFTIDADNNIIVFASKTAAYESAARADATEAGTEVFATAERLAELVPDSKRLVAIWNSLTGVTPVKKFMNNKAAVRRIFAAIQKLEADAAVEAEEPEPPTTPAKAARVKKPRTLAAVAGSSTSVPRPGTKQDQVITMLRRDGGATLDEINAAMGWQQHTTRALMSAGGALRKKYGLVVVSETVDDQRTYRIGGD